MSRAAIIGTTAITEHGQEQLYLRADDWREGEAHRALFGLLAQRPA